MKPIIRTCQSYLYWFSTKQSSLWNIIHVRRVTLSQELFLFRTYLKLMRYIFFTWDTHTHIYHLFIACKGLRFMRHAFQLWFWCGLAFPFFEPHINPFHSHFYLHCFCHVQSKYKKRLISNVKSINYVSYLCYPQHMAVQEENVQQHIQHSYMQL